MLVTLLILACGSGTVHITDKGSEVDTGADTDMDTDTDSGGDTDTDSGGDTDTDSGGDTDTDSGGDTDTDSGGDTDTDSGGDTDTDTEPASDAGTYGGLVTGTLESDWGAYDCEGEVSFTITEAGELSGKASCLVADWGDQGLEGELSGTDTSGDVVAVWAVDLGWGSTYAFDVTGIVGDSAAKLKGSEEVDRMGTVAVEMDTIRE